MNWDDKLAEKPKEGQRWRVTIEGTICNRHPDTWATLQDEDGTVNDVYFRSGTWERLPDPEPEWQPGDLVITPSGEVWERLSGPDPYGQIWCIPGDQGNAYMDSDLERPLTRLIRES